MLWLDVLVRPNIKINEKSNLLNGINTGEKFTGEFLCGCILYLVINLGFPMKSMRDNKEHQPKKNPFPMQKDP